MKRNNIVFLIGKVVSFREEKVDRIGAVGKLVVATDIEALGGHHQVLCPDERKIAELKAAMAANGRAPLEVAIIGYLARGMVIAERLIFLINEDARALLKQMLKT